MSFPPRSTDWDLNPFGIFIIGYYILLGTVLAIAMGIIEVTAGEKMQEDKKEKIISRITMAVNIAILIGMIIGCYYVWQAVIAWQVISTQDYTAISNETISSLTDSTLTGGHFILGTGSVSEKTYFFCYAGVNPYRLKKVPTDSAGIFTDEEKDPHISTITQMRTTCHKNGVCESERLFEPITYEIHVPNGTIKRNYNLDGEV